MLFRSRRITGRCPDLPHSPAFRQGSCGTYRPLILRWLLPVEEVCKQAKRIAVLENVVNPTNVGAIFRSAAALGMDAVLLTGGCADPFYRRAIRVSMGTVFQIPWTYIEKKTCAWPEEGIASLRKMGFKTAAMALKKESVSIDDKNLLAEEKLAVILGTEGDGLATDTIADCDYTVLIPMAHVFSPSEKRAADTRHLTHARSPSDSPR